MMWTLWQHNRLRWRIALEFKPADLWRGVYCRRADGYCGMETVWLCDVWVCLLPTLPIHVSFVIPRRNDGPPF
jgi:hypothetical protein